MKRLDWVTIAATAVGLALAIYLLGRAGLGRVLRTVETIGIGGFLLFLASYGVVLVALGLAWLASGRYPLRRLHAFVWARTVREAANDLLPFSQIGGLLLGMRVLAHAGIALARAYAATVIDLSTEIISQCVLVLAGIAIALNLERHVAADPRLEAAIWSGAAMLCALAFAALMLRRPALALISGMAGRIAPSSGTLMAAVQTELGKLEQHHGVLTRSFLANLAAWLLSVLSIWLALRLLGHPLPVADVLALEALISVVRSSAFVIPGALGAQEAGYVLIGALVGLDHQSALALSLLKRARDIAVGVPTLLAWQLVSLRRSGTAAASEEW